MVDINESNSTQNDTSDYADVAEVWRVEGERDYDYIGRMNETIKLITTR